MKQPLIFGEILFDQFPDGNAVLGGAPFNVATHLQGFGLQPIIASAVGQDELGDKIIESCAGFGLSSRAIQRVSQPTGRVAIELADGQPSYTILDDQAYDHVQATPLLAALEDADVSLIYHGSLALRHHTNLETVQALKAKFAVSVYVDINLREPWWSREQILSLITHGDYIKLNDDEFMEMAGFTDDGLIEKNIPSFMEQYGIRCMIVTQGAKGVHYANQSEQGFVDAAPVKSIVDTVGAGDSLAAVTMLGLARQWPLKATLQRAVEFASSVCEQQGATIADAATYKRWLDRWLDNTSS